MKLKRVKTPRGFGLIEFKDRYNVDCNIQKSSLATEDAIWFGAKEIGLKKIIGGGWEDIDTENHIANNRMHLTQKQVKKLLPILKYFAKTGSLPSKI